MPLHFLQVSTIISSAYFLLELFDGISSKIKTVHINNCQVKKTTKKQKTTHKFR